MYLPRARVRVRVRARARARVRVRVRVRARARARARVVRVRVQVRARAGATATPSSDKLEPCVHQPNPTRPTGRLAEGAGRHCDYCALDGWMSECVVR